MIAFSRLSISAVTLEVSDSSAATSCPDRPWASITWASAFLSASRRKLTSTFWVVMRSSSVVAMTRTPSSSILTADSRSRACSLNCFCSIAQLADLSAAERIAVMNPEAIACRSFRASLASAWRGSAISLVDLTSSRIANRVASSLPASSARLSNNVLATFSLLTRSASAA